MFGLGISEIAVVLALALLVLGPEKLPAAIRSLARFVGETRKVADEMRRNFEDAAREADEVAAHKELSQLRSELQAQIEALPKQPALEADFVCEAQGSAEKPPLDAATPNEEEKPHEPT